MLYRKPETVVEVRDILKEDRRRRRESTVASQSASATAPNPAPTPPTSPPGRDPTDYVTVWERLHPPAMTVEAHPSPGGSRMVKTYVVRPKVFYGEPDPNEAPPRRPPSFTDPLPHEFLDPAFREQFTLGSSSPTLALELPPWLHSLRPCVEDQNSSPR
eukprot:1523621-Pleurochrysis_carterae.AAC.1